MNVLLLSHWIEPKRITVVSNFYSTIVQTSGINPLMTTDKILQLVFIVLFLV